MLLYIVTAISNKTKYISEYFSGTDIEDILEQIREWIKNFWDNEENIIYSGEDKSYSLLGLHSNEKNSLLITSIVPFTQMIIKNRENPNIADVFKLEFAGTFEMTEISQEYFSNKLN